VTKQPDEYARFKESVKKFAEMSKRIHEISQQTVKAAAKPRRKYRNYQKGLLQECPKPYRNRDCQALVGGRVFCLAEAPCWKGGAEKQ